MKQTNNERLLKLIAEVAEQAYRRGFQHGTSYGGESPTEADLYNVAAWRFDDNLEIAESPRGDFSTTALERLKMERPDIAREIEGCAE